MKKLLILGGLLVAMATVTACSKEKNAAELSQASIDQAASQAISESDKFTQPDSNNPAQVAADSLKHTANKAKAEIAQASSAEMAKFQQAEQATQ